MPLNLTILIQRADIVKKSGGDVVQFENIQKHLDESLFRVNLTSWDSCLNFQDCDIVNLVNDRPLFLADSLRIINELHPRPKIVISPIHHNDREVINLRKYGYTQTALERIFAKMLKVKRMEIWIFHFINILADLRMIAAACGFWISVKTLVRNFTKICTKKKLGALLLQAGNLQFLAKGEMESFFKDYQIEDSESCRKFIIPNGKPIEQSKIKFDDSVFSIVTIGRIEPRKGTLELAQIADKMGIPITFIGAISNEKSNYAKEFIRIVSASTNITYLGEKSHAETCSIISRSKVLLNASFAEVLSLVEIEAAAQGKWIVSRGAGYSNEYIPPNQLRIYPENNLRKGLELASQLATSQAVRFDAVDIPSWDEIADSYSVMYQEVILEKI
jgi:glycosyltransferase involved in cell wall biosynthesis